MVPPAFPLRDCLATQAKCKSQSLPVAFCAARAGMSEVQPLSLFHLTIRHVRCSATGFANREARASKSLHRNSIFTLGFRLRRPSDDARGPMHDYFGVNCVWLSGSPKRSLCIQCPGNIAKDDLKTNKV